MIEAGQHPRFAEMCALQQAPGTKGTDRALMEGRLDGNWVAEMGAHQAGWVMRETRAAGINTNGKYYMSGLADKRGHLDPEAWVDSVSDIRRVAKKRNLNVQGIVNIEAHEEPPKKSLGLSKEVTTELAEKMLKQNPKLKASEAIEAVKEKHTPHWKKPK